MSDGAVGFRERFETLDERFRERTLRERVLLAVGAVACVLLVLDGQAIRPVAAERSRIASTSRDLEERIGALETELDQLTQPTMSEAERRLADERAQLERQLEQIGARLSREVAALVPPEAIVSLLEEVLAQSPELELVKLESRPPERLGDRSTTGTVSLGDRHRPGTRLYRHGLRIEIAGTFSATLDYLERLERSRWHLLWDRLDYAVERFPTARVTIDLHTLSEQEDWIGV